MKGLLLKDWYVLLKQGRIMFFLIVFYTVLSVNGNEAFGAFASVFVSVLPLTLMGIDERNKWDILATAMPYRKRDIVLSRYLIVALGLFILGAVYFISAFVYNIFLDKTGELFQVEASVITIAVGLIYPTFSLPIVFRLGVEKARLWSIISTGGLAGIGAVFMYNKFSVTAEIINFLLDNRWFIIVVSILLFMLSAAVSVRLYEKREF